MVGTAPATLVENVEIHMADPQAIRRKMAADNPYGDGRAAQRIAGILCGLMGDDVDEAPATAFERVG